jgi:hypothetical protein
MSTQESKSLSQQDVRENTASTNIISGVPLTMMIIAFLWFAAAFALGFSGFLSTSSRFNGLFVVVPPVVFVLAFARLKSIQTWAFAFETRTLVLLQSLRVAGIAFLAVYAAGKLNGPFALWAGLLDAAVGVSALFVAHSLTPPRTASQWGLLIGWMGVGILDFFVAVPLALVARVSDPTSMVALSFPPLSLITTFAVPVALIDYFILSAHLWRQRRQA